jgi:hypothetical protein
MQELLEFIDVIRRIECGSKCMIEIDDLNYIALQKCDTNDRLKIHHILISQMNYFAEKYGKINCKICTIFTNSLHYITDFTIDFVNAKIIEISQQLPMMKQEDKIQEFTVNVDAELYIGCKPINGGGITLIKLYNGDIPGNEHIKKILEGPRFAKTKSARN